MATLAAAVVSAAVMLTPCTSAQASGTTQWAYLGKNKPSWCTKGWYTGGGTGSEDYLRVSVQVGSTKAKAESQWLGVYVSVELKGVSDGCGISHNAW